MPTLNIEELYRIKGEVIRSSFLESGKQTVRVTVHMGTCGISSGAGEVLQVFEEALKASRRKDITVTTSGCVPTRGTTLPTPRKSGAARKRTWR